MNATHPSTERNPRRRARSSRTDTRIYPPYLKRKIPLYDLLTVDGVEAIEYHAELILQEFGIQFRGDAETIHLFVEAGAEAQDEIVRFPPGLIKRLIQTTPHEFIHHARNPERSIVVGPHSAAGFR